MSDGIIIFPARRRRAPNAAEKIAACLLMLKRGDEWLIPEPLRSTGTAEEIMSIVQWDHAFMHSSGGDTRPQNLTPMRIADHAEKTRGKSLATSAGGDIHAAAQSKRIIRKQDEFRARMLAKQAGEDTPKRKSKAAIRGGRGDKFKCGFGKVVDRETGKTIWGGKKAKCQHETKY